MISIIDYNLGNVSSIRKMIEKLDYKCTITNDREIISKSKFLILPGVGSFDTGILNLKKLNLKDLIIEMALNKKVPILGICLGMQLLANSSEEGVESGLGLIPGHVKRFDNNESYPVPHIGWSNIKTKKTNILTKNINEPRFYFVHSLYFKVLDNKNEILASYYPNEFTSGIKLNNIYGVQFHPEKSHKFGLKLLDNFIKYSYEN